jgi:hypothetical protein
MAGIRPQGGGLVKQRYMLSGMRGRSTYKLTWEEIVELYRLTLDQPLVNTQARQTPFKNGWCQSALIVRARATTIRRLFEQCP